MHDLGSVTDGQRGLIERYAAICHGQAVVKGTRIMVSIVLDAVRIKLDENLPGYTCRHPGAAGR